MTTQEHKNNNNNHRHKDKSGNISSGNPSMGKSKQNNFLRLSLPGLGLLRKFQQYRRLPQEPPAAPTHHLEEELDRLTGKIDNLLCRIEGQDQEIAKGQEEECVVCGTNRASMQTLPCAHQVVCRQCFVRTIQMAVAQKRLPLRCILCRAKVLRIKQDHRGKDGLVVQSKDELIHSEALSGLPKSVSGYNIGNYISSSGSNYSFTSGVSAVSSESSCSRKSSLARDFSFSSLSNFQNVNLLNKSQIPRSKSGSFCSRRARRSRSPSPLGGSRSKSVEGVPPIIKIERSPSDECLFPPSPASPLSPGLPPARSPNSCWDRGSRSPRSPTSPTSPNSPVDGERIFSSRGSSRLSTPLSPIKESRKESGSLLELHCSPVRENKIELQSVPKKPSSRIRCTEKILTQLEVHANVVGEKEEEEELLMEADRSWTFQKRGRAIKKLSSEDIASFERNCSDLERPTGGRLTVKHSKSVTFKDC
eukprot:TRINITY_DN11642_c0_g1_i1.p1 TRINITY_DN11642_c0_g1~~TRINITY_DN11642_c0_g1_i1.p1  ORF type:complete len:476 (-),score=90.06 TRINITY_DN11642_c0_g1_i1:133-1560(-)